MSELREHHRQIVAELADTAMALARRIAQMALAADCVEDARGAHRRS